MLLVFGKGLLNVAPLSTRIDIWICRSCNISRDYNKEGSPVFLAFFFIKNMSLSFVREILSGTSQWVGLSWYIGKTQRYCIAKLRGNLCLCKLLSSTELSAVSSQLQSQREECSVSAQGRFICWQSVYIFGPEN